AGVAGVRRAGRHLGHRAALAHAVTISRRQRRAVRRAGLPAGRRCVVVEAVAETVANSCPKAARGSLIDADAPGIGVVPVDRPARALVAHEVAGKARTLAREVAADAVGTIAGCAVLVPLTGSSL